MTKTKRLLAVWAAIVVALAGFAPSVASATGDKGGGSHQSGNDKNDKGSKFGGSKGDHHEERDGCDHGNTGKDCKPDPQPDKGKDCDKHGNHGGVNEDHCSGGHTTTTKKPGRTTTTKKPRTSTTKPGHTTTTKKPTSTTLKPGTSTTKPSSSPTTLAPGGPTTSLTLPDGTPIPGPNGPNGPKPTAPSDSKVRGQSNDNDDSIGERLAHTGGDYIGPLLLIGAAALAIGYWLKRTGRLHL